jgi:hypothetical protein
MTEATSQQKTLEQISNVLAELANADSLEAAGRIVEMHGDLLLTDSTFSFLEQNLDAARSEGDDGKVVFLKSVHDLLKRCRAMGVNEALAEIAAEEQFQPQMMAAFDAYEHFSRTGDIRGLGKAISLVKDLSESVQWERTPAEVKGMAWGQLIAWQCTLYEINEHEDALSEAKALSERALAEIDSESEAFPFVAVNASGVELLGFKKNSKIDHLNFAIELLDKALNKSSLNVKQFAVGFLNMARALQLRFENTDDAHDVDSAINVLERVLGEIGTDDPELPPIRKLLGRLLALRFQRTRSSCDLDKITTLQRNLEIRNNPLIELAEDCSSQFLSNRNPAKLDRAIELYEQGLETISKVDRDYARIASNLGAAYGTRFDLGRNMADLDGAITWLERAYAHESVTSEDHIYYGVNLAQILCDRCRVSGNSPDLERGIEILEHAVTETPQNSLNLASYQNSLAAALDLRFNRSSKRADADRSVELWEKAVAGSPIGSDSWCGYLGNLCNTLSERGHKAKSQEDIEHALRACERLIELMPALHPSFLSFLRVLDSVIRDHVSIVRHLSRTTIALRAWKSGFERLDEAARQARREAAGLYVAQC